jgi:DNA invertase Pin-like site-specific DNA recombinase
MGRADVGDGIEAANDLSILEALLADHRPPTAPAPKATKAIAWARVSQGIRNTRGPSLSEQLRQVRAFARASGYEITAEYREVGSAYHEHDEPAGFERMLNVARRDPEVGAILVHDYSRFSRNRARAMHVVRDLLERGVRVISVSEPEIEPTTVAGIFAEAVILAKNEAYSRDLAFHVEKGLRANVQTRDEATGWCYKNGGRPPLGYRPEYVPCGRAHHGREAFKRVWLLDETVFAARPVHEWVRHCLVELAARGAPVRELCECCEAAGIPPSRADRWLNGSWGRLLRVDALLTFCGYGLWNMSQGRSRTPRPPSEWAIVPAAHPAIITEDEARAVAAARERLRTLGYGRRGSRVGSRYLLSGGIFRCGLCGGSMSGNLTHGKHDTYVCKGRQCGRGPGTWPSVAARREYVENAVIAAVEDFLTGYLDADGSEDADRAISAGVWGDGASASQQMARELGSVEHRLGNIRRALAEGLCDTAWADSRVQELLARKEALVARTAPTGNTPPACAAALETYLEEFRAAFSSTSRASSAERRGMLWACLDSVVFVPSDRTLRITCHLPASVVGPLAPGGAADSAAGSPYHAALVALLPFSRRSQAQVRRRRTTAE